MNDRKLRPVETFYRSVRYRSRFDDNETCGDPDRFRCWAIAPFQVVGDGCGAVAGFCHQYQSFHDRISGDHPGGQTGASDEEQIERLWAQAANEVQWRGEWRCWHLCEADGDEHEGASMTREKSECSAAMLTALFAAIKHGRRVRTNTESFIDAMELGWFADYQIRDRTHDLWLVGFTDALLADAGVTMATYHYRPRRIDRGAGAFQGLRAADMARFLIYLERLGLNVDPAPLVDRLLPQIKQLRAISWSELSVLWFARERHKSPPLALYTPSFAHRQEPALTRREDFKTEAGYKISAYFVGDEVHFLEVRAPRYRHCADPALTICEVCGVEWLKGDPAESASHCREHKKRLTVLQPSPDPQFLTALAHESEPELVTATSPKWRQQAMYARALMFQRAFGYDFVQWASTTTTIPRWVHGTYTGTFGHGAIVGACAFRWREYADSPPCWAMQWVWIAPKARRRGVLSRRRDAFRARFGKFVIEPPLSEAMQAFATKHDVVDLVVNENERRTSCRRRKRVAVNNRRPISTARVC